MKRTKPYVAHKTLQDVYKTLIQPHFDYCSPLWYNLGIVEQFYGIVSRKMSRWQNR